jgi:uncharacterized protein (TIRG00374 family)
MRRLAVFVAKLALAALLVWWLVRSGRLNTDLLVSIGIRLPTVSLMLAGAVCVFLGQLLLAVRLRLLLMRQAICLSYARALGLTLIGSFFGAILPGLVSGDAVKTFYLFGDAAGGRSRAVAAVLIDRILGLYSLCLLGSLALAAAALTGTIPTTNPILWSAPLAVLCVTALLALLAWRGLDAVPIVAWLSSRAPDLLQRLTGAFRLYLSYPRLLAASVALSLINHALVIMTFLFAGILLKDSVSPHQQFIVNPLAMVLNVIPLTPGGIGITEGAFSFLYDAIGSSNGAAVGLLGRVMQYVAFALAGIAPLLAVRFGRRAGTAGAPPGECA